MSEKKRTYHYQINIAGDLLFADKPVDDPGVIKLFFRTLKKIPDGRFFVNCMGEDNFIIAEDCPYVISSWNKKTTGYDITMQSNLQEDLDPSTLYVGKNNVLYAKVRQGKFTARFNRKAYLSFAQEIQCQKNNQEFYLSISNQQYEIKIKNAD